MFTILVISALIRLGSSAPQWDHMRAVHYSPHFNGYKNFYGPGSIPRLARQKASSPDYIDPEPYVQRALNTPLVKDKRINAARDASSPSAAAALEYMKQVAGDDICAVATEAYLEMILHNATAEQANAEATRAYILAHNKGLKPAAGSACEASVVAWRQAEKEGTDPVVKSALAFMNNFPGLQSGNPCAVSGVDYVKAILDGKTHTDANLIAAKSFAEALFAKAKAGEELRDPACAIATKAYFNALEKKPSPPNAAAMIAFIDKAFSTQKFEQDPICWRSTEAFWQSYEAGNDELTSNLAAAEVFLEEFAAGSTVPVDSPCAAATRAYYDNIPNPPSPANKAAMVAFMDKMIRDGRRMPDPVCAGSTKAYWKAYKAGASEVEANLAAAEAFFEEFAKGSTIPADSPCAASTVAYFENLPNAPSPPNKAAMKAFMDKMIADGPRQPDPVCALSTRAFWDAWKSGEDELTSNLAAGEAFFDEFMKGSKIPADSPCAAATRAYYENIPTPPSPANKAAMEAFMDKMIADGERTPDPVCAMSLRAYWDAYKNGDDELSSNLAAAEAFFHEFAKGSNIPVNSPCAAATRAYYANIPNPPSGPNKAAMEAFMDKMISDGERTPDPVCAASTLGFWASYKTGGSEFEANLAAGEAFFEEFIKGSTIPADSPCAAATRAYWKATEKLPSPANQAAMEAFMNKMITDGSKRTADPVCASSAKAYFNAWKAGMGELKSNLAAAEGFFDEFSKGSSVPADSPCAASAMAYLENIPNPPSPANKAAMVAFMNQMVGNGTRTPDPVCAAATRGYWSAWKDGKGELESNLAAAESFFEEFAKGSSLPADSPCAAATRAYYANIPNPPSGPNKAAMEAFMDKMIKDGERVPDPVCAASTKAFWDAYKNGVSETKANLAAAEAFLTAYNDGLNIPADSPCVAATKGYYSALPKAPSGPNAEGMISFIDHMIKNGGKRIYDPVCAAASKAFFDAHKAGDSELTANLKAAQAFFKEYRSGATLPADSACAAATKMYASQLKSKPSQPNALAMMTFIDESISGDNNKLDPVCAVAAEAYFDAYLSGKSEAKANQAAGIAFLDAVANTPSYSPESPCGRSAETYMKSFEL
ncbi:uncharacterized protein LOC111703508 [Eurytemora carolleeae]|uniref:uncharacterized protein LOC111703508 n=1 Tax=Eurytemora carolleeae TaxID=1294199 RepID=UPI000C7820C9|nr:uncharacterized protein LOC111703508 [Eurytemora carolleeae]|eukprot:XP_023331231.1 uncharacterized protein LOC111703508 [Eurytemora affinis]